MNLTIMCGCYSHSIAKVFVSVSPVCRSLFQFVEMTPIINNPSEIAGSNPGHGFSGHLGHFSGSRWVRVGRVCRFLIRNVCSSLGVKRRLGDAGGSNQNSKAMPGKDGSVMTTGLAVVFAVASGLAVGNLYWAQPLLAQIAGGFGVPVSQGGLLVTATQAGYALGILLIVPLGDIIRRRRLVGVVMALSVAALLACAVAPSFAFLGFALASLGAVTVSGQVILPLAGDLASPLQRGRIVGIVSSGITTGILLSRFVSGVVAEYWDWRSIYVVAAVMNLVMLVSIVRRVPDSPKRKHVSYPRLIASVFTSLVCYRALPCVLIINGLVFGIAFNLFWTALTFLLSGEPFGFSTLQIGFVSLAGIVGALSASAFGGLQDRGKAVPALGLCIAAVAVSMAVAVFSGSSIVALVVVAAIQSLAVQGVGVLRSFRD